MISTPAKATSLYQRQSDMCRALDHPVRLAILDILRGGEQCVCHMEAILGLRQAYISQHLRPLRDAGLVTDRRDGWNIFYRVRERRIYRVTDALNAFSGRRARRFADVSASSVCPCPKCSRTMTDQGPDRTHA